MPPRLFTLPYDSGHRAARMGAGPLRLARELPDLVPEEIEPEGEWRAENATAFQLYRRLARRVAETRDDFPIVLAGNCGAALGTTSGVGTERLGIVWFDAHGDFLTPDNSPSGFLDGMGLSILTGRCWRKLASTIPGFAPLPFASTLHVGGRDFDPGEREDFDATGAGIVDLATIRADGLDASLSPALDRLAAHVDRLVLHIDLDVVDSRHGVANHYASLAPGGLTPDELLQAVTTIARRIPLAALELAAYDPAHDPDGRIAEVGRRVVAALGM